MSLPPCPQWRGGEPASASSSASTATTAPWPAGGQSPSPPSGSGLARTGPDVVKLFTTVIYEGSLC
jgi:hypothetical protein